MQDFQGSAGATPFLNSISFDNTAALFISSTPVHLPLLTPLAYQSFGDKLATLDQPIPVDAVRGGREALELIMNQALETLNLSHLKSSYPGEHLYPLSKQISVWPMNDIVTLPEQLR